MSWSFVLVSVSFCRLGQVKICGCLGLLLDLYNKGLGNAARAAAIKAGLVGSRSTEWWYDAGQGATDFTRGVGSALTFGTTDLAREALYGESGKVIKQGAFFGGEIAGTALQIYLSGGLAGGARAGGQIFTRSALKAGGQYAVTSKSLVGRALLSRYGAQGAGRIAAQWAPRVQKAVALYNAADLGVGAYHTGKRGLDIAEQLSNPCGDVSWVDWLGLGAGAFGLYGGLKGFGGTPRPAPKTRQKSVGEWFKFWGDLGGETSYPLVANKKFLGPKYAPTVQNFDVPGTFGYLDTAVHEGFHALLGKYVPSVFDIGNLSIGRFPVGPPVKYLEEVAAYGLGRLFSGRIHAVPLAPIEAFGSLESDEIITTLIVGGLIAGGYSSLD